MTTTDRSQVLDRYPRDVASGRTFHYIEQSHTSADRMGYYPMVASREYGQVIATLGAAAQIGDRYAAAVADALPKVSPYFNGHQIVAGIARAFGKTVREGWYDVAAATGPEAGRPSAHQHPTDLPHAILLNLILTEVTYALRLGSVPGPGWAIKALVEETGVRVPAHLLPNVAKALSPEAAR